MAFYAPVFLAKAFKRPPPRVMFDAKLDHNSDHGPVEVQAYVAVVCRLQDHTPQDVKMGSIASFMAFDEARKEEIRKKEARKEEDSSKQGLKNEDCKDDNRKDKNRKGKSPMNWHLPLLQITTVPEHMAVATQQSNDIHKIWLSMTGDQRNGWTRDDWIKVALTTMHPTSDVSITNEETEDAICSTCVNAWVEMEYQTQLKG